MSNNQANLFGDDEPKLVVSTPRPRGACTHAPSHLGLVSTITGQIVPLRCKSYSCPDCGPQRAQRLYAAVLELVDTWNYARLWTFTLKRRKDESTQQHRVRLTASWRAFLGMVRGNSRRAGAYPKLQYLRFTEFHSGQGWQHGYRHYHVLCSQYMHAGVIIALWKKATGGEGSADVKSARKKKKVVSYVVKYVTKAAADNGRARHEPVYSRSHGVCLFAVRTKSSEWTLVNFAITSDSTCLDSKLETLLAEDQHFLYDLPPPDAPDVDFQVELDLTSTESDTMSESDRLLALRVMAALCE